MQGFRNQEHHRKRPPDTQVLPVSLPSCREGASNVWLVEDEDEDGRGRPRLGGRHTVLRNMRFFVKMDLLAAGEKMGVRHLGFPSHH